jgi:uncharacterized protein (TIGR04255 family)
MLQKNWPYRPATLLSTQSGVIMTAKFVGLAASDVAKLHSFGPDEWSHMTFPETQRVIYAQNPLVEVICQLKFPPILRIDTELPAAFQEAIRRDYPSLKATEAPPMALSPTMLKLIQQSAPGFVQGPTYQFLSEDGCWTLGMARDFLALSTTHYKKWEDFRSKFQAALDAFIATYAPSFLTRIGLRYRDVIKKSWQPLKGLDWPEILQPHILGELGFEGLRAAIQHAAREVVISLSDTKGQVRILHGLMREAGDTDFGYSIDSDFYCEERIELKYAFEVLDIYNREAGRLFRWFTTPTLHERLGPTNLP